MLGMFRMARCPFEVLVGVGRLRVQVTFQVTIRKGDHDIKKGDGVNIIVRKNVLNLPILCIYVCVENAVSALRNTRASRASPPGPPPGALPQRAP